jgi:hypothetical protein
MYRLRHLLTLIAAIGVLVSCSSPERAPKGQQAAEPIATGSAVPFVITPPRPPTATLEVVPTAPPSSCPVTLPPDSPFAPPASVKLSTGYFWLGTEALWTEARLDGTWRKLPYHDGAFTEKVVWWRKGYDWQAEPQPNLVVTGRGLDAAAPPLVASRANGAFNADDIGSAMMVGVDIPAPGCWEITGQYEGTSLSFVVWVAP